VSPKQEDSAATARVPSLENDHSNKALKRDTQQRHAVPLIEPESPIAGTGMEYVSAQYAGPEIICQNECIQEHVEAKDIVVRRISEVDGKEVECDLDRYKLEKYIRSNQGTCYNQVPIVQNGDRVTKGEILADGPSMEKGELALGRNVLVGFMTWE